MNSRQLSILHTLLLYNEPVSAQQVGNMLNLSARTVRYNLNQIETWLNDNSLELENKPSVGLFIPATEKERSEMLGKMAAMKNADMKLSQDNRCLWIEFELLNYGLPYKAFTFQYQLGISHNTGTKDLNKVEKALSDWNLELKRTPGLGTEILGQEKQYRYCLISLIRSIVDENDLISLCSWNVIRTNNGHSGTSILKYKILKEIQKWDLGKAWRLIKKIEKDFKFSFSDSELVRHTLYTALMGKRIKTGHIVDSSTENLTSSVCLDVFEKLHSSISVFIGNGNVDIPEHEISQLTLELTAGKSLLTDQRTQEDFLIEDYTDIAEWILVYIGKQLGYDLLVPSVVKMLAKHLKLSISRIVHNIPLSNPLLEDIENNYFETMNIVRQTMTQHPLLNQICFPSSEIGYITLFVEMAKIEAGVSPKKKVRVVVVCPSGGITVGMLIIRIKNELNNIEVVDVLSLRDFNRKKLDSDIDAVITTSPSLMHKSVKVICVNPLLEKNDILKIKEQLNLRNDDEK
jgi:transcriptional antiterminator